MGKDRPWSADTVAFRPAPDDTYPSDLPRHRPARSSLQTSALRPLALVTVTMAGAVTLFLALGGEPGSKKVPIRQGTDPLRHEVAKLSSRVQTQVLRRESRRAGRSRVRESKRRREPKPSIETRAKAPGAAQDYIPLPMSEPEAVPSAPTSPGVEFGL